MTDLYQQEGRCYYCKGCDQREECVDPLRRYVAVGAFTVDGIHYNTGREDVNNGPIVAIKNDRWCTDDGCEDCIDTYPQQISNPPTEAELDRWMSPHADIGGCPR